MWKVENLYEKLNSLPEPTRSYATSLKAASINSEIFTVAKIDSSKWAPITLLIAGIIVKEIELAGLEHKIKDFLGVNLEQATDLAIEISGARLLIFDDWLDGEVEKYLKSHGVNLSRYAPLIAEQQLAISKEREYFEEQLAEEELVEEELAGDDSFQDVLEESSLAGEDLVLSESDREAHIEARKRDLLNTLSGDFLSVLKADELAILDEFNYSFVLVWIEDEFFHTAVSSALLSNQEEIAKSSILDSDEEKPATISNLLRTFIKKYGLTANDLNIAQFLSSKAVSLFSDAEKVLALRILKFNNNTNNLDSYIEADFQNVPEGFEVLSPPAISTKDDLPQRPASPPRVSTAKPVATKPLIDKKPLTKPIKTPVSPPKTDSRKVLVGEKEKVKPEEAKEAPEKGSTLTNELEKILQDYPPGSLEHKTISQEIRRLELRNEK